MTSIRTPLAKVRGLGSAHHGTGHWIAQRVSAILIAPLGLWFVASIVACIGDSHDKLVKWISSPFVATALVLLLSALFYHAKLGVQIIIEDYVKCKARLVALRLLNTFACYGFGLLAVLSVVKLHLG